MRFIIRWTVISNICHGIERVRVSPRERKKERERMDYSLSINRHDGFASKCQSICVVK